MKNKRYILVLLSAAFVAQAVSAGYGEDYDAAIDSIVSNNRALAGRRAALEGDRLSLAAENNLSDPDVEFEHQWGQGHIGNKWSVSVSQSFDWPGLYKRRAEVARSGADAFRLLYEAEAADLRLRVAMALNDYVASCQRLSLANEIKNNLDSLYLKLSKAFEHGEATIIDMKKIRFERAEAISRLNDAVQAVDALKFELIGMNGGKYIDLSAIDSYPAIQLHDEDYYVARYSEADPNLLAAKSQAVTAQLTASAEKLKAYPSLSLGYIHNVEIGEHFNGLKIGVTLPVFSTRKLKQAAQAKALAATYEADEYAVSRHAELMSQYAVAVKLRKSLENYNEIFSADGSDNYLALLKKSYDGGQMTLINYLYEVNYYIEVRMAYLSLLNDYNRSLISLNRFD
ncbi:MAG: TolC family protein [Muribaculaceae bacterium]|nr:TolC family protein [Muribaculaceae bacterium]